MNFLSKQFHRRCSIHTGEDQECRLVPLMLISKLMQLYPLGLHCLHYEYVCSCGNSSSSEESMMVLPPVPVVDHISKCIDKLLLTQTLSDENRWFCNVCNAKQDGTLFVEVKKVRNILILHLKRFINDGSNIFRDNSILACPK